MKRKKSGPAYVRAAVNVGTVPAQDNVVRLLHQIADITESAEDPAGARYFVARAHNAGFRVAICVTSDGEIGWCLV